MFQSRKFFFVVLLIASTISATIHAPTGEDDLTPCQRKTISSCGNLPSTGSNEPFTKKTCCSFSKYVDCVTNELAKCQAPDAETRTRDAHFLEAAKEAISAVEKSDCASFKPLAATCASGLAKLGLWAWIGIGVGALVLIGAIILISWCLCCKDKK